MYMNYFLGYQISANNSLTEAQKELRARNTFLLALDGDVDFQPDAIIKLVDLMKRNPVSFVAFMTFIWVTNFTQFTESWCILWQNSSNWKWLHAMVPNV